MKNNYILFVLGMMVLTSLPLRAQTQAFSCSTPPAIFKAPEAATDRSPLTGPFIFQIFVHILRDNNGSNAAMTEADMLVDMQQMASFFQPHNICFILVGWDYIDNTTWNSNYDKSMITSLHAVNPHDRAIDIYVHRLNFNGSGGNAYGIPSPKCSVSAQTPFNFTHEMGHCLGLAHTFETANGMQCPSNSNCDHDGDGVCDTPADFSGSQNMTSGNCIYNGTQTTFCNGQTFTYQPPTDNIMSYWASCYARFTAGQRTRMEKAINDNGFLQDRLTLADRAISAATLNQEVALGAWHTMTIGNINNTGNVVMNGDIHGFFNAGTVVQILPGTRVIPAGSRSVVFRSVVTCAGVGGFTDDGEEREAETKTHADTILPANALTVVPNPFTGTTTITYNLSTAQDVDLRIFSPVGQLVAQPFRQEFHEAGQHEYQFNADGLPAGVYFLVLQVGGQKVTKRLVLSR